MSSPLSGVWADPFSQKTNLQVNEVPGTSLKAVAASYQGPKAAFLEAPMPIPPGLSALTISLSPFGRVLAHYGHDEAWREAMARVLLGTTDSSAYTSASLEDLILDRHCQMEAAHNWPQGVGEAFDLLGQSMGRDGYHKVIVLVDFSFVLADLEGLKRQLLRIPTQTEIMFLLGTPAID